MKYRKTPKRERSTYIYRFDDGDKATVSIGKMTLIIHDGRTFTYPDESITQESIGMLHRLDDKEVRELGKMVNMESPQEKKSHSYHKSNGIILQYALKKNTSSPIH